MEPPIEVGVPRNAPHESVGGCETARIVRQIASALGQAHAVDIVHRDIKPANLFLTRGEDGGVVVKVLDFGIAKLLAPAGDGSRTTAGMLLGTPLYYAPEQALGAAVGPAADVYSLGALTFEMLAGRPPFEGDATQVIGQKISRDAPTLRAIQVDVPTAVSATVARMLARDAGERLASMAEVSRALESWPVDGARDGELAGVVRSRRWLAALVLSMAALSISLALWLGHRPSAPAAPTRVGRVRPQAR